MIWLAWRQHRSKLVGLGAVFLLLACGYVALGAAMRGAISPADLPYCFTGSEPVRCGSWSDLVDAIHHYVVILFPLLPALVGMFLGAPLVANELEHHTHRFAWTQGLARSRWLSSKLLFLGACSVLFGVVFSVAYAWWFSPALESEGWFATFDFGLVSFPATSLFGFLLGVAAGALTRRTLAGMAATLAVYLPLFVVVKNFVRPHYLDPVLSASPAVDSLRVGTQVFVDAQGAVYSSSEAASRAGVADPAGFLNSDTADEMARAGYFSRVPVQPADRYWTLQVIEAGLFLALAGVCVALVFWCVNRRLS
ncbi:hypothetical protein [Prauserella cavernicola]|uniref:ABC transporter permease n=1 Tax=Prauserella cavernicola TaxID=2800127 RepID=A0A934QT96_9PSEU|nr:hypothetical protein [Prauserella cavernicola]MBK1785254.1 hypothetical protein [Prauserella cavernicola]